MFFIQFIFCFRKLGLHVIPRFFCVKILVQTFCFCNCLFQSCCALNRISTYDIVFGCFEGIRSIGIAKGMNRNLPVAGSIGSFRKLAAERIGKSKLDSHCFMHPVIGSKFRSVCCLCIGIGRIIVIVCPSYRLHIGCQVAIIPIQIYTEEFAIRTISFFYSKTNCCSIRNSLQSSTRNAGCSSGCTCRKAKRAVRIFHCCFQSVCILCYICYQICIILQLIFCETTREFSSILHYNIFLAEFFIIVF